MKTFYLLLLVLVMMVVGPRGTQAAAGGGGGGGGGSISNTYQFNGPFTVQNVTSVFLRPAISNIFTLPVTNAPWTTNLAIHYDLATAVSNQGSYAVINILPGTNSPTPKVVTTNGFGAINVISKTNVLFQGYGVTLSGRAAVGEILYITNSINITFRGFTFDGLVVTNITTAPTNLQWGIVSLAGSDNITFEDCRFINGHNFGLIDLATTDSDFPTLTTNVTVRNCYFYNCGSALTNNPLSFDGAAIAGDGWVIENNLFEENLRGVELFDDTTGRVTEGTIIRNNRFFNTLDVAILTGGVTNANGVIIEGNRINNAQGYTRRGTNYQIDAMGIYMPGGQRLRIIDNTITGTNFIGILVGGVAARMDDLAIIDNTINGFLNGLITGSSLTYHLGALVDGNTVINALTPYSIRGFRNGAVLNNVANNVGLSGQPGFQFFASGGFQNTNVLIDGNLAQDTLGNMDFGFSSQAGNNSMVFGINQSVGHTAGSIEGTIGANVILRGHVGGSAIPEFTEKLALTGAVWVDRAENLEPLEMGFYDTFFGISNRNTTALSFYNPSPSGDDWAFTGNLRVGPIGASKLVRTTAGTNLAEVTIGSGVSFDGTTLSATPGTIDTTPFALLLRTTNSWADGSNGVRNVYTNVFHSTSGGITNVAVTNLADGQTLSIWLFPSNGVTVTFNQFATTDHIDGSIITPATNIWSWVQVTRRGVSTNILVQTATYGLEPGSGVTFSTNFATRTITVTGSGAISTNEFQFLGVPLSIKSGVFLTNSRTFGFSTNLSRIYVEDGVNDTVFITENGIGSVTDDNFRLYANNGIRWELKNSAGSYGLVPFDTNVSDVGSFQFPVRTNWNNWVVAKASVQVVEGAGSGKVLTSDANGVGSWQSPGAATRENVSASATATNLSLDVNKTFVLTNDLRTDPTYALSNLTDGVKAEIHILGQTNAANNRTVTFTAAQGGTINWQGSGTNGPSAFTVFSNATATIYLKVVTNLTQTNIIATWVQDSFWPQPMSTLYAAAGGSTSNVFMSGNFYFDTIAATTPYTNHSSAGANYTNLATAMLPANLLTNQGDSVEIIWRGRFRGANNGTNQLIAGIGTITNGLGDTGQFTNTANVAWEYQAEVTAIGPTNHNCYWQFHLGGATTLSGSITNFETTVFATGILTNGATNVVRLQGRGLGAGAITNDYFKIRYHPGIR